LGVSTPPAGSNPNGTSKDYLYLRKSRSDKKIHQIGDTQKLNAEVLLNGINFVYDYGVIVSPYSSKLFIVKCRVKKIEKLYGTISDHFW
jgi:hypothetical protein